MANIGDRALFGLAEGVERPCVLVAPGENGEWDVNVDVSPQDNAYLKQEEKVEFQPIQIVGDYAFQRPVCIVARVAVEVQIPRVGAFWFP